MMNTFYSLIKIVPNEMSDDSLTIGIVLSSPEGIRLKISKAKKTIAKSIIETDGSFIDFIERELVGKIKEQNKLLRNNAHSLFETASFLSTDYFQYLSSYCNGLLIFTAPNMIADSVDDHKFLKLYHLFVDSSAEIVHRDNSVKEYEKKFYTKVNTHLISKVQDKVHTHKPIESHMVPTLSSPFEMDCIGLNGALIGAKSLPFIQSKETLSKSINTYISVIVHLSVNFNRSFEKNKFYLIADEPDKNTPVFNLWENLRQGDSILTVVSSEDSGEIAEFIETSGASKFIE